ncbi:NAD(P)/FAD-dependent oxidoreductase [Acidimangrovimonas sediminis]|uniref:NAD(P)/FAD-dependent oxidoreductase n=1 Tax=Acidimangrovimonas sediminis TaxID=2056283 RepID=UPI000C80FE06|nr:FAD-dependent oxidoreductase [Acidimangrovimonas sediminis]
MTHDILIIGGGIAGIAAAARLSPLGKVLLLEAEGQFAHHASGRSAALYEPGYGSSVVKALNAASEHHLFHADGGVLSPRGLMIVGGPGEEAGFEEDCADMGLTPIPVEEAQARVPILNPETVTHTAVADHGWDIDTDLLIQNFLRAARANGAETLTATPVTAIMRQGGAWQVTTPKGNFAARILVNAAGPWADTVSAMAGGRKLGLQPYRRSMARIAAPEGHEVASWPMIFGAGETWYAKPDAGALIVSPSEAHPMDPHDAWADDMVLAEGLARYEERVTAPVTRMLANWAGLRTFAPDRALVIGPDSVLPDFFWTAGQGGYGFQTSAGAADLLAAHVGGTAPALETDIVAALHPARFDG